MTLYCALFEIYCIRPPVNVASSIRRCFQTSLPSIKKRALLMVMFDQVPLAFRMTSMLHGRHHNLRVVANFWVSYSYIVSLFHLPRPGSARPGSRLLRPGSAS